MENKSSLRMEDPADYGIAMATTDAKRAILEDFRNGTLTQDRFFQILYISHMNVHMASCAQLTKAIVELVELINTPAACRSLAKLDQMVADCQSKIRKITEARAE